MNWNVKDIKIYEQSKEYIDTAIIPLLPFSLRDDVQSVVQKGEFISILTEELEREYRGRMLLLPPFVYMASCREKEERRLQDWAEEIVQHGIRHIIYITSDYEWKSSDVQGTLFWLPALPLEQLDNHAKREVIHSQIYEIMNVLTENWK
ncbi:YpiF family protein [Microbacteriaceae bacterium 4G12]